jgi:hypothetical protein
MKFQGTKMTGVRAFEPMEDGAFVAIVAQVILDEGGGIAGSRSHRLTFSPEMDIDDRIGQFNAQSERGITVPFPSMLAGLGLPGGDSRIVYPPLRDVDVEAIRAKAAELWTPAVVAAAQEAQRKRDAEAKAEQDREAKAAAAREAEYAQRVVVAAKELLKQSGVDLDAKRV